MKLEVLVSTMYNKDTTIIDRLNIKTDAVIINQCDFDESHNINRDYGEIKYFYSNERGLSKSRNRALENASKDICLLCDDDEVLVDGYAEIILTAFNKIPEADVIVFNIEEKNSKYNTQSLETKIKRIPKYKTYGSVRIAFKRKSIVDKGITFDTRFGSGSGMYAMAEDSIFFHCIHRNKLRAYVYPEIIAKVDFGESTWFKGYNEKYFYDIGAFLSVVYPRMKHIFMFYYLYRMKNMTDLKSSEIIKNIKLGFRGYKKQLNYDNYVAEYGG